MFSKQEVRSRRAESDGTIALMEVLGTVTRATRRSTERSASASNRVLSGIICIPTSFDVAIEQCESSGFKFPSWLQCYSILLISSRLGPLSTMICDALLSRRTTSFLAFEHVRHTRKLCLWASLIGTPAAGCPNSKHATAHSSISYAILS